MPANYCRKMIKINHIDMKKIIFTSTFIQLFDFKIIAYLSDSFSKFAIV